MDETRAADPIRQPKPRDSADAAMAEVHIDDLVIEDLLVEDVSIDGMCGVY